MKRVAIIQVRMTSTRLPGKVLMDLAGRPMLARQMERLRHCKQIDEILIATTTNADDDLVAELAHREGAVVFRGDEEDVLSRFVGAAEATQADVIVRLTGDCPLADPEVVDRVVASLIEGGGACDYASNVVRRTFPRGLDAEAFSRDVLMRFDRLASTPLQREHVTLLPRSDMSGLFLTKDVVDEVDSSRHRWTVDVPEDLDFIRRVFEVLDLGNQQLGYREILRYLDEHPEMIHVDAEGSTWEPSAVDEC